MENVSPLYNKEPAEVSQFSPHPGFVLGEAHSLHPEDFIDQIESDEESFHSAEMSIEIDELSNAATVVDQNKKDDRAVANDEMEVTTTTTATTAHDQSHDNH